MLKGALLGLACRPTLSEDPLYDQLKEDKSQAVREEKFYIPTRPDRDYPSAIAALEAAGFSKFEARTIAARGTASADLFVRLHNDQEECLLLKPTPEGGVSVLYCLPRLGAADFDEAFAKLKEMQLSCGDYLDYRIYEWYPLAEITLH